MTDTPESLSARLNELSPTKGYTVTEVEIVDVPESVVASEPRLRGRRILWLRIEKSTLPSRLAGHRLPIYFGPVQGVRNDDIRQLLAVIEGHTMQTDKQKALDILRDQQGFKLNPGSGLTDVEQAELNIRTTLFAQHRRLTVLEKALEKVAEAPVNG